MAHYRSVMPFLVNGEPAPGTERLQSIEDRDRFDDTTKCILCAACTTSCPAFWAKGEYVGPAAIVQAHRFIFDSRDRATIYNCTEACPRDIQVTQAIAEVKREMLRRGL